MNKTIATYEIKNEVSVGAISTVYKAFQPSLERIIVLKVLRENVASEPDIVARFQREAKACAKLKHENIVDIFDYGVDEGKHYIAMEFVEGISIEQLLTRVETVPLEIVIFIIIEVLKGLSYAHSKTIFHRDIKPGNILLSNQGDVKITDFGLAVIPDSKTITLQNTILGTPAYMSPEQISGEKLDCRSDIFSLGATLYEMLTKVPPFAGKTYSESLNNVLNKNPVDLDNLRPELSTDINTILKKILHKKRKRRFENCELITDKLAYFAQHNNLTLTKQNLKSYIKDHKNYSCEIFHQKSNNRKKQKLFRWTLRTAALLTVLTIVSYIIFFSNTGEKQITNNPVLKEESILISDSTKINNTIEDSSKINHQAVQNESAFVKSNNLPSKKNLKLQGNNSLQVNKNELLDSPISQKKFATLLIKCAPWAKIFIDNQFYKTVYEFDSLVVKQEPGEHEVVFINPDFAPFDSARKMIRLFPGQTSKLIIPFVEIAGVGFLKITMNPWAEVFVNEITKGVTPLEPIILKQGKYRLVLKHPQLPVWRKNLVIKTGETSEISVDLMQAFNRDQK